MADPANQTSDSDSLTAHQKGIVTIAAWAAVGNIVKLNAALHSALDSGLTVSAAREILIQLYAYAGFPRSLNALGELMKVLENRKQRGVVDPPGELPSSPIPKGDALLQSGTDNQTRLSGSPVKGALFEFAPAIDEFLKTHLFGDIFERDNLDWMSREVATVSMLSALSGVEPQLQAHVRMSMNIGLTDRHLREIVSILDDKIGESAARRAGEALDRHLAEVNSSK